MSRINDEENERHPSKKGGKVNERRHSNLFTYHPTKEHRLEIGSGDWELHPSVEIIQSKLADGCSLSVGFRAESDGIFVIIRDATAPWNTAVAVSVWHKDLRRALCGLAYYLDKIQPGFPDVDVGQTSDNSW